MILIGRYEVEESNCHRLTKDGQPYQGFMRAVGDNGPYLIFSFG